LTDRGGLKSWVRPFSEALPLSNGYWIVCPKATMLPKISRARDWLLAEAADDMRRLKELAR
jgi:LysR family transcriptional regulator, glycine cleavage system transcriptional activator